MNNCKEATMDQEIDSKMQSYYKKRAPIYDRIYSYPERQEDFRYLETYISEYLSGLDVLEIAAGTGYWTQFIRARANSLLATDTSIETLNIIGTRELSKPVSIQVADAYSLDGISDKYNGAFAGLWISHVPRQRLNEFLRSLHQHLSPGAKVLFMDNTLAQCARLPLSHTDTEGNTYQERALDDNTTYTVLKNFPTKDDLLDATASFGKNHKHIELEHFWLLQYEAN
jgi:SAM-dependent methyltransferase